MFTPRTEGKFLKERATQRRLETMQTLKDAAVTEQEAAAAAKAREVEEMKEYFDEVLGGLEERGYSLADLMEYVFNPATRFQSGYDWRWRGFFAHKPVVQQVLGYWSSARAQTTRTFIWNWAYQLVRKVVAKVKKTVNEDFFVNFSLCGISTSLRALSPTAFGIFNAYSSTKRQEKAGSKGFLKKREVLAGSVALALLNGRSQKNSYTQAVCGTYLMATGAQRQHFSVLHGIGFSMGYSSIISQETKTKVTAADSTTKKKAKKKRARAPGTLWQLSQACRATARSLALTSLFLVMYDNINMMVRVTEQILGRKNTQENGTCATEVALHDAKLEDLLTADFDKGIANAPPLTVENLEFTETEAVFFHDNIIHTILRIIVRYGGESFEHLKADLEKAQPVSADKIAVHQSMIHPLPAMEIDENLTKGNIEVIEAINKELALDVNDPNYIKYVKILAGDQLTIARQRSILQVRLGHESGAHSWKHIVLMPGLFHAKIADCHGVLQTHFGKPSAGFRSPGSLGFHNTVLDRLPIVLTSLPPFRTCRDLIMVSLYARILHCVLLVSKKALLADYAKDCSWDGLVGHAEKIYEDFASADRVQELREVCVPNERRRDTEIAAKDKTQKKSATAPKKEPAPHIKKGDMVFENAILFVRDALLTREFADAIKARDSGCIVLILKLFAFTYRGNGCTKYAHEMLHVLHNIVNVWSDGLRHTILHNWLLCPTNKANAFVEVDLVQEHLNLWIKVSRWLPVNMERADFYQKIYKADGDAHSWDWLAFVSPCVDVLRRLATSMNNDLGSRQGNKHTIPDLDNDIHCLMASLTEHEVYIHKEGRVLDDDEMPAPDVLSAGAAALTHGTTTNPLQDFNALFDQLRQRRELIPVSELTQYLTELPRPVPARSSPIPEARAAGNAAILDAFASADASEMITAPGDNLTVAVDSDPLPALILVNPPDYDDEEDEPTPDEDLFADSPTLTRLDPEDVDLDMDEDWMLDPEPDSGSEYDSDDEANIQRSGSESD
ncbi:hypothetical protein C8F04DRAFT_1213217 [Mycena alexandri]|uniref:DUF6589 domain-containing protein n=1 Tax=Mycena alexandri TaxID=1745969 RepID=A0AAD6S9P8_9AGAR|nr:hypothetical protein C8F04DRAFT_1213217 [Mycena alexandri]